MHKQTQVRGKRRNQTMLMLMRRHLHVPACALRLAEVNVERSGNDRARNILILEVELVI